MELIRRDSRRWEEVKLRLGEWRRWSNGDGLDCGLEGAIVREDGGCKSLSMAASTSL